MRMVFLDDSVAFDGFSPASQPLDGAEKALAGLSAALAMRGHEVLVFNRCELPVAAHGVRWELWDTTPPADIDLLVAFRRPDLLDRFPGARRRVLWAAGAGAALDNAAAQDCLARHKPLVVFLSETQRQAWTNRPGLETVVIQPGIAADFLADDPMAPEDPPHAVATAHPLAGLDWLIRVWSERIRPEVPGAELHLYSALLDRGRQGGAVPAAVAPIVEQAKAAQPHGVVIRRPQADPDMAKAYRSARVHLHPGSAHDVYGFALAESQAMGLPAITRANNPLVVERIADRQTGIIAATDEAFASAAITLLTDRLNFDRMSAAARTVRRGRSWAVAAAEWEERLG